LILYLIMQGMNVAVAGIPKTIDNDVDYIDMSFGFQSAVEAAQLAIRSAKTEAICNMPNGVGVVKLMGRSAGFIAAHATMSSGDVDLCLVPEVPIVLEGENGCLPHIRRRVKEQGYAVIVVAEGAGEDVLGVSAEVDASGNKKLPPIGDFMKKQVELHFQEHGDVATVKYIDPSYTVRSVAANAADSLCKFHFLRLLVSALQHRVRSLILTCTSFSCCRLHATGTKRCSRSDGRIHRILSWLMQQSYGVPSNSRTCVHLSSIHESSGANLGACLGNHSSTQHSTGGVKDRVFDYVRLWQTLGSM
jgi:Phosphofructokinase